VHSFHTGGLEKGIATIVKHASSNFEHIVLCLSTSGESARLLPFNTNVIELRKPPGNSPFFLVKLARTLKSLRPDVVHTRNWGGMDGIIAARLVKIRSVVHGEHGWGAEDPNGLKPKRVYIRRFLNRCVCEYTGVSKEIERWLRDEIKVRKPITQIYNGVDTEKYHPAESPAFIRSELGLAEDAPLVGVVARLDPIKDHQTLFRAFRTVQRARPEARLIVIGDGPERTHLESEIEQGVIFLGNRSDVPEILQAVDVFVLPSLNEGISNTILEAMATTLPIVATRVGGNPELVEAGRTGILVEPGDSDSMASALLRYINNLDLQINHGRAARQRVLNHFSIQSMVQSYESVYRRVATAKAQGARCKESAVRNQQSGGST
jgi:sugar transferase (PEP-CTERM/EpsH1 system associated)